jgi:hypothetical protein
MNGNVENKTPRGSKIAQKGNWWGRIIYLLINSTHHPDRQTNETNGHECTMKPVKILLCIEILPPIDFVRHNENNKCDTLHNLNDS